MVTFDSWEPLHIREIRPKDLYLAQILRNGEKSYVPLMVRLILNPEALDRIPARVFKSAINWCIDTIFADSIMTLENWLEVAFHLCKQRWDSSIDWLEMQPMSKIKLMISINEKHVQQQEDQMKKASKKKR